MIRYALACENEHAFESWFRDSAAFDVLEQAGHLACPDCGSSAVRKALMAPSVLTSRRKRAAPVVAGASASAEVTPLMSVTPAQPVTVLDPRERRLREMLRTLHREITDKAENVGRGFAVEARRIHEGDAAPRSIYGEASRPEVEALLEDGIPLLPLPTPPDEHN